MRRREPMFCMPISGRNNNRKTLRELEIKKIGYFLTGLLLHVNGGLT